MQLGVNVACHAYKKKQNRTSVCAKWDGRHSGEPDQDGQLEPEWMNEWMNNNTYLKHKDYY